MQLLDAARAGEGQPGALPRATEGEGELVLTPDQKLCTRTGAAYKSLHTSEGSFWDVQR